MNNRMSGAAAGAAATVPMTWSMEAMHRLLPLHEEYSLPPREVAETLAEKARVAEELSEEQRFWLALASHFGYGATAGALYGALAQSLPGQPIVKGTAYDLAVWAGSYLGLLPALNLLRATGKNHWRPREAR